MKVLVTGACGFVGRNIVPILADRGFDVATLDVLPKPKGDVEGYWDHLEYRLGSFDESLGRRVIEQVQDSDIVLHLASQSHVDRSITGPKAFIDDNVSGTLEILEMCRNFLDLKKFILFSTDEVGACKEVGEYIETGGYKTGSVYSATKAAQECLAEAYVNTFDLPIITTRCVNIFGPHQWDEKFIPTIIKKALADEPVPLYGDGSQTRQWAHVNHVVEFLECLIHATFIPPGAKLHITGTDEIQNSVLAHLIVGILGKPRSLIQRVKDRPGHDIRYALARTEETDRYMLPEYDKAKFMSDLIDTIQWYVGNGEQHV